MIQNKKKVKYYFKNIFQYKYKKKTHLVKHTKPTGTTISFALINNQYISSFLSVALN